MLKNKFFSGTPGSRSAGTGPAGRGHHLVHATTGARCTRTARTITSEETTHLLSAVRMGVNLNLITDLSIDRVNQLYIHAQPAHLQELRGRTLDTEERNVERATYLRMMLNGA